MNYHRISSIALSVSLVFSTATFTKSSFNKLTALFGGKQHEESIYKEYTVPAKGTITIDTDRGDIQVKAAWDQPKMTVKAIKKSSDQEQLANIRISEKTIKGNLCLTTACAHTAADGAIDYVLIVPKNTPLNLVTGTGTIKVKQAYAPVKATTVHGEIEICNAHDSVTATTQKKGNIVIEQPHGSVQAIAQEEGAITIHDSYKGIEAKTGKGRIIVSCKQVPSTESILLETDSGNIQLTLPKAVNATLHAKTEQGTLTSDHQITIKPMLTQLNADAWNRFKRKVDGTLGSGEATITLNAERGNIKITKPQDTATA